MAKPEWSCLKDATIIDLSQLLPGPHAASLLMQLGATVIKVEQPGSGDTLRAMGRTAFAQFNRGKQSVALDLKNDADRESFLQLVRGADAVIEGFRPGVMRRLGLDYQAMAEVNPRIVLCSVSGFGQTGPYADHAGHDLNYLSLAGYWAVPSQVEDKVARPCMRLSDYAASMHAALALAVAMMSARQNGCGQHLDVSIHDAIFSWMAHGAWAARAHGGDPARTASVMPDNDLFETRDGRHVAMGILENKFWINLREALGGEHAELEDPRFESRAGRQKHKAEVHAVLKRVFAARTLSEWIARLDGLDVPFSPVLDAAGLFADPHVQARAGFRELPGEEGIAVGFPVRFSAGLPDPGMEVPALGEHNDALLLRSD
ncbi:MAG: CaiB/BaiF CoA transferase family protein [Cupriavidus necator]